MIKTQTRVQLIILDLRALGETFGRTLNSESLGFYRPQFDNVKSMNCTATKPPVLTTSTPVFFHLLNGFHIVSPRLCQVDSNFVVLVESNAILFALIKP